MIQILELKKIGLKINSLARKIEESEKSGSPTRIPGYITEMEKQEKRIAKFILELKLEFPEDEN